MTKDGPTMPAGNGMAHERLAAVAAWLASAVGAETVAVRTASRLAGGAVQENWRLDVDVTGGPRAGSHAWVLRTDAAARIPVSLDRASEFEVLRVAHAAGIKAAEPIARCDAAGPLSAPFLVQQMLPGVAQARRIVRDPALAQFGERLAGEIATEIARIHAIHPGGGILTCLPIPALSPARHEAARLRHALADAAEARPALEYILAWLDRNAPPSKPLALVHGDLRTGNYLVDQGRLAGLLDWEFAHWGDPDEDLGWLTAPCWRFGNDTLEVGGIARLAALTEAYQAASGRAVEPAALAYWQIMAAAKWATIAVLQGDRYRKGGEARLELALTGLMAPEMEHDALSAILDWQRRGGPSWR